jgi:hypothetical protein
MRWQRSAERAIKRWCDLTSEPDRFQQLWGSVAPVVLLGTDYTDEARSTFVSTARVAPVAAQGGYAILAAVGGDLELCGAFFSGGAAAIDVLVQILPNEILFPSLPSVTIEMSSGNGSPQWASTDYGTSINGTATTLQVQADATAQLDFVRGMILEKGRGLALRATTVNQVFKVGFAWRNAA